MAIVTKLEELMKKRSYTLARLASEVRITEANLSRLKTGKCGAIRFSTLEAICRVLNCQPGDILEYKERKKVIPLFLDYTGTTDLLLKGGAENVKRFFDSIRDMQEKLKYEIQITMVTGSAFESARSKHKLLSELAQNYGLSNLFDGVIAEYCGFIIRGDKSEQLLTLDPRILVRRSEIEELIRPYSGQINPDVTSMYNIVFDDISREDLSDVSEQIEKLIGCPEIEAVQYFDCYGRECDVKSRNLTKSEAVYMVMKKLEEKYDIPFVIIGGDSKEEDFCMYTRNKDRISQMGFSTVFIAPSNIGEIVTSDRNVIVGDWENSDGISDCIGKLTERANVREDGGIEL